MRGGRQKSDGTVNGVRGLGQTGSSKRTAIIAARTGSITDAMAGADRQVMPIMQRFISVSGASCGAAGIGLSGQQSCALAMSDAAMEAACAGQFGDAAAFAIPPMASAVTITKESQTRRMRTL